MLEKRRKESSVKGMKSKKRRKWNTSGGLEGLPLQLIIMMIIAAIGISIVVAWLTVFSEKPLHELEIESIAPDSKKGTNVLTDGEQYTIKIKALNTDQKPMEGVTIVLEGPGVNKIATTDSDGIATFSNVEPTLGTNVAVGMIDVTGNYKSWSVTGPYIGIES